MKTCIVVPYNYTARIYFIVDVTVVIFTEANYIGIAIPLKHKIHGQNKIIPGHNLKIGQIPGLSGHPWTVGNYGCHNRFMIIIS